MISILTATYNRANLLRTRIASTLNQTYKDFELVIIDDFSNDNTEDVVKSFNDKRIKYFKMQKNIGSLYGDRYHINNFIYNIAKGEYFIYAPDDDYWPDTNFLENCINFFVKYPTIQMTMGSQITEFYENEKTLKIFNKIEINEIIKNKDEKFFFFGKLLPETGFYNKKTFIKEFSHKPTTFNISVSATIFKMKGLKEIKYLQHKTPSKWQAGYELILPNLFLGDIYFINEPCAVVRAHKNNASFTSSQVAHYKDSLLSINNAFSIAPYSEFNDLKKIKKRFISSLSQAYLHNSIQIFKNNELTYCSNDNIANYVTITNVVTEYFKNKIFLNLMDIRFIAQYIFYKILKYYPRLFLEKIINKPKLK